ncbi:hypothetical protein [Maribacter sp. ACAM166]|uniref:hypothetical protein n=1 Tax=Maribacter sp. ACAM166 TaxID=2508996 RepID=UPI0010FE36D6|nr:hypothetical protein [Maribacter sp. ACAM166]TLP75472.1 hypothetical protein ES765_15355 [Maribacter sp. ACAM166]
MNEENIGGSEESNFYATQVYPVNLKISTNEEFEESIIIYTQFSGAVTEHSSHQTSSERIILLDKNQANPIIFNVNTSNPLLSFEKLLPPTNSEMSTMVEVELFQVDYFDKRYYKLALSNDTNDLLPLNWIV